MQECVSIPHRGNEYVLKTFLILAYKTTIRPDPGSTTMRAVITATNVEVVDSQAV